ncbi:MAG: transposase [Anaerolineales bacterium]|nr:transposase [Anaerolineales bacterium]
MHFLWSWRLYLKRRQVKALHRQRRERGLPALAYHSLPRRVPQRLTEIAPQLPRGCRVYVLFAAWYASHRLFKSIRAHGWHWICAAKANRRLDAYALAEWWQHLGHQPIERVTLRSTKGSRTYATRHRVGRLHRYPDPVIAVFSKRNRRDTRPAYFLCSDTTLSVRCILKYYSYCWQAEVDNFFLKERLGLADYRLQSCEAITRWPALVFAAYAFLQFQRVRQGLSDAELLAELMP